MPPIITVGSAWAAMKMWVVMEVVVVLPWVPAMHTAFRYCRMMAPQASARSKTGMPPARAAAISGLSSWIAAVRMTNSAPWMSWASWPTWTEMPSFRSCSTTGLSVWSLPWTARPMLWSTSARGLMDTPPMPARWTRRPGAMYG